MNPSNPSLAQRLTGRLQETIKLTERNFSFLEIFLKHVFSCQLGSILSAYTAYCLPMAHTASTGAGAAAIQLWCAALELELPSPGCSPRLVPALHRQPLVTALVPALLCHSQLVLQIDPSVPQPVFKITEKAPTRAFSWLKVPTSAFTSHLRHY